MKNKKLIWIALFIINGLMISCLSLSYENLPWAENHLDQHSSSSDEQTDLEREEEMQVTATDVDDVVTETLAPEEELAYALDFQLENLEGELVSLSDFRGKAVLINFWATWCPPCRAEMPLIQAAADEYETELIVLTINAGEPLADVRYFVHEHEYGMIFLIDPDNEVSDKYKVKGLPTSFFIDPEGVLRGRFIGEMNEKILKAYLGKVGLSE